MKFKKIRKNEYLNFIRNLLIAILIGGAVGGYSALFALLISLVTKVRMEHNWLVLLLPFSGLFLIMLYRALKVKKSEGTNRVLASISGGAEIPLQMGPLITLGTAITHLFGGSAGKEGAALQIGGCYGYWIGKLFRLERKDLTIMTMCGMSAAFSAIFGTPVAAVIFPIEVISVGIMQYSAIVPCAVASVIGFELSKALGVSFENFQFVVMPNFDWLMFLRSFGFGIACAIVSVLFCIVLHRFNKLFHKFINNAYLGIFTGGLIVVLFTMFVGNTDYMGNGLVVIENALNGQVDWYAFIFKMVITAITLGCGFKGGEVMPTIFIGATFGCFFGPLLGIPAGAAAALGVCGLFCGVTNCPIAALFLSFELFGFQGIPYFVIVSALSYCFSGYYSLYSGQKFTFSKSSVSYINRNSR